MKNLIYFLITVVLICSCKKDKFEGVTAEELRPFIEDFIEEGQKRDITLSKDRLESLLLSSLSEERSSRVCGLGWANFNGQNTQRIEILETDFCWESRSYIERENLVFHELGHALLNRQHFNATFSNGNAKSIMCSGSEGFCSNFNTYYENEQLKDYYLDELFDSSTPSPAFAQRTNFNRTVFEDQFEAGLVGWEEFIDGDPNLFKVTIDSSGNYATTALNAMLIEIKPSVIDEGALAIVKRFELTDFQDCSSLILKADIRTEGEMDGFINMALSLRERLPDGNLNRFFIDGPTIQTLNTPTDIFKDFELELYCVPERTEVVSVSFSVKSKLPVKFYIDNIRLDLVE